AVVRRRILPVAVLAPAGGSRHVLLAGGAPAALRGRPLSRAGLRAALAAAGREGRPGAEAPGEDEHPPARKAPLKESRKDGVVHGRLLCASQVKRAALVLDAADERVVLRGEARLPGRPAVLRRLVEVDGHLGCVAHE